MDKDKEVKKDGTVVLDLVNTIEENLSDEEKNDVVFEWLFLTTWMNQIFDEEYNNAEDLINFIFDLVYTAYGINFELKE